jgi:ABC-type polysaccharide/polyol phosphate export permease
MENPEWIQTISKMIENQKNNPKYIKHQIRKKEVYEKRIESIKRKLTVLTNKEHIVIVVSVIFISTSILGLFLYLKQMILFIFGFGLYLASLVVLFLKGKMEKKKLMQKLKKLNKEYKKMKSFV